MTLAELRKQAYASDWDEFFDKWLPMLIKASESHQKKFYHFGSGACLTVNSYYVDADKRDVWMTRI